MSRVLRSFVLITLLVSCGYPEPQEITPMPSVTFFLPRDAQETPEAPEFEEVALSPPPKPKLPPVRERGLASGYSAWAPEWITYRKKGRLRVSTGKPYCWYVKKVKWGDPIIAHRHLPCGTQVHVTVGKRRKGVWLTVGDRGPYGACIRKSDLPKKAKWWQPSKSCRRMYGDDWVWYIKIRKSWPGVWRGIADISHTARRVIKHNGFQTVTLRYWRGKKTRSLRGD